MQRLQKNTASFTGLLSARRVVALKIPDLLAAVDPVRIPPEEHCFRNALFIAVFDLVWLLFAWSHSFFFLSNFLHVYGAGSKAA